MEGRRRCLRILWLWVSLLLVSASCSGEGDDGLASSTFPDAFPDNLLFLFDDRPGFDGQEPSGAVKLFEGEHHAAWLVRFEQEVCRVGIERYEETRIEAPVSDLGLDELLAGVGCGPEAGLGEEGHQWFSETQRASLAYFVLPTRCWGVAWTVDSINLTEIFHTFASGEQAVVLEADITRLRRYQAAGLEPLIVNIGGECADVEFEMVIPL